MPTPQPKYRFYATLLDRFSDYLGSDALWERYWGFSDNPPHTPDEFRQEQFRRLIDAVNRVPFDSEAADRGTAFNEVVDALIERRRPRGMEVERTADGTAYTVCYKERQFTFPVAMCREFADYYKGALTQQWVEAKLPTALGTVLLCGYVDELMPLSVHDIKTTGSYWVGKYKNHWQHRVYPYCLMHSGSDVRLFEYNVTDFRQTYTESYTFIPERDVPLLRAHCEEFIRFLNDNRTLITDKKIFCKQ